MAFVMQKSLDLNVLLSECASCDCHKHNAKSNFLYAQAKFCIMYAISIFGGACQGKHFYYCLDLDYSASFVLSRTSNYYYYYFDMTFPTGHKIFAW